MGLFLVLAYGRAAAFVDVLAFGGFRWLLPSEARGSHAEVFRWVSEHLPADARLAGEAVETFYSHRRYLQIQPAAQGQIDLAGAPGEILAALRARGVTHIHLSPHLDIPPADDPLVRKWLSSFAAIPEVFGLPAVYNREGERIYDIAAHLRHC